MEEATLANLEAPKQLKDAEGCMPYKVPSVLTTTMPPCRGWQLLLQSAAGGDLGGPGCQHLTN